MSKNHSVKRDATFDNLRSRVSMRTPLAYAVDAAPAVPTNLSISNPPGVYEEASFIYNTYNQSMYFRSRGPNPEWKLISTGGGAPSGSAIWEQVTDPQGTDNNRKIARLFKTNVAAGTENTTTMVYGSQTADSGGTDYSPTKMMFRIKSDSMTPDGAFRAGSVNGTQWDDANIGISSVAFGQNNIASGGGSFAIGNTNTASGLLSFVGGAGSTADQPTAFAFGNEATASGAGGFMSVCISDISFASGAESAVIGGQRCTASGGASGVFCGVNCTVEAPNSTILGGFQNNIQPAAANNSVICGGNGNTCGQVRSGILSGQTNSLLAGSSNNNCIGGGQSNEINGTSSTHCGIFSGNDNIIGTNVNASVIAGGGSNAEGNTINSGYSFIGSGRRNIIDALSESSVIVGGGGSEMGDGNSITAGQNCFIGCGVSNDINTTNGNHNSIVGGSGNIMDNTGTSVICGGSSNNISRTGMGLNNNCFIGAGITNKIENQGTSGCSLIVGGESNNISSGETGSYNCIGGGSANTITSGGSYNAIFSGLTNTIGGSNLPSQCIIGGGNANSITGSNPDAIAASQGMGIFCGRTNLISLINAGNGSDMGIFCGNNNRIQDNTAMGGAGIGNACIMSGQGNQINGNSYNTCVLGGSNNAVTDSDNSVVCGQYATITSNSRCFVWGDANGAGLKTTAVAPNVFAIGSSGGLQLGGNGAMGTEVVYPTASAGAPGPSTLINSPTGTATQQAGWLKVYINGDESYLPFWKA